jgi:hypothetical protein
MGIKNYISKWFKEEGKEPQKYTPTVTMGWDFHPTIVLEGGGILLRKAEMIINAKYYPTGTVGEWPCCPDTGEKLEIDHE